MARSTVTLLLAAVQLLAVAALPASARDGDLDPTFGIRGKVVTDFGSAAYPRALAVHADGRIVVAGVSHLEGTVELAMARYESDGTLDTDFGTGGIVETPTAGTTFVERVLIQPDDKIVLVADELLLNTSSHVILIARYESDGTLDQTFGTGGMATFSPSPIDDDSVEDAVLRPDGMILITGLTRGSGTRAVLLMRVDGSGALDPTFGSGGVVTSDLGDNEAGRALALQSDDSAIVGGSVATQAILARYQPDGTLDATFGTGGVVTVAPSISHVFGIVVQPSGAIVAGVSGSVGVGMRLVRYDALGVLDEDFGTDGVSSVPVDADFTVGQLSAQPDGKLLVAGTIGETRASQAVVRFDADGNFDPTLSACGAAVTAFEGDSFNETAFAFAVQPDGRFLLAGAPGVVTSEPITQSMGVARFGTPGAAACMPAATGESSLKLKFDDKAKWKWTGSPVTVADFGAPQLGDDYTLCLVDPSTGQPRYALTVPGTTTQDCTRNTCWRAKPVGYVGSRLAIGKSRIKLIATETGSGKLTATGKIVSSHVVAPTYPYPLPVVARMKRGDGACWEATYSSSVKNSFLSGLVTFSD